MVSEGCREPLQGCRPGLFPLQAVCLNQTQRTWCLGLPSAGAPCHFSLTKHGTSAWKPPMKREFQSRKNGVFYLHPLRMLFSRCDLEWRCTNAMAQRAIPGSFPHWQEGQVHWTGANVRGSVVIAESPGSWGKLVIPFGVKFWHAVAIPVWKPRRKGATLKSPIGSAPES